MFIFSNVYKQQMKNVIPSMKICSYILTSGCKNRRLLSKEIIRNYSFKAIIAP